MNTYHVLPIHKKYIDLIRTGIKTVEGRVFKEKYKKFQEGDYIKFEDTLDVNHFIFCQMVGKTFYPSFRAMLITEKLEKCLPGLDSIEEGEAVYHGFPFFEAESKIYGVIALKIKLCVTNNFNSLLS